MPQQGKDFASSSTRLDSSAESLDAQQVAPSKESVTGSWLQPPLSAITAVTLRFPVATLIVAVSLAAVAAIYALTHLGYRSSRLDLLNPKSPYNRLWIQYINEFGDEDDAVIVVEGPGRDQIIPVIDELSAALEKTSGCFTRFLKTKISRRSCRKACTTPQWRICCSLRLLSMPMLRPWMASGRGWKSARA